MATLYVDLYSGTKKQTNVKYGSSEYLSLLKSGYKLTSTSKRKVESAGLYSGTSTSKVSTSSSTPTTSTKTSTSSTSTKSSSTPTTTSSPTTSGGISLSTIKNLPNLEPGMSNSNVYMLQRWLVQEGYMTQAQLNTGPGTYGPQTTAAVAAWQKDAGVNTGNYSGYFGPASKAALGGATSSTPSSTSSGSSSSGMSIQDLSKGMVDGSVKTQADVNNYKDAGSSYSGGPYNMSQYGLVRFEGLGPQGYMNDNIVWLVDPTNQTIRPFESERALRNFFDGDVDINSITVMGAEELGPGGIFGDAGGGAGFQVLSSDYAIQRDGSARQLDYSNSQLSTRYGHAINEELEQTMYSALKGIFNILDGQGISGSTLNKIKTNDSQVAFYVSALAYGGYSIGDIYSDIKKRELGIDDVYPISPTATKADYVSTNEYQDAAGNNKIAPPATIGSLNSAQLDLPVYQLPDEAFKTLIPILDYDSKEFQDAMDAIETSYYDLLEQQLNASTEQEKAIADYNYQQWKDEVEQNLGIQLSNNALEAWSQIEQSFAQYGQRGIFGSGIQNEDIDSYLRRIRRDDQIMRDQVTSKEDQEKMNYYLSAASSDQIKELVDTNPELAKAWGLVPSDDVKAALNLETLKEKYPNAKEEDLAQYISILLDENGNYRSSLYQNQVGSMMDLNPGSASLNTKTGINTAKEQFQYNEALRKSLLEEENAYKEFTTPDVAFLRNTPDESLYKDVTGQNQYKTQDFTSILNKAKNNLYSGGATTGSVYPSTKTSTTTGTTPTSSQLSSMYNTLKTAQSQLDAITARSGSTAGTNTYTAPKITTNTSVTNPTSSSQYSSPIGPVYNPNQNNVSSTFSGTSSMNTANTTPSVSSGSSTSGGGTISSIWNKLKSWF